MVPCRHGLRVVNEVGLEQVIAAVGPKQVIDALGLDRVIEETGVENLRNAIDAFEERRRRGRSD